MILCWLGDYLCECPITFAVKVSIDFDRVIVMLCSLIQYKWLAKNVQQANVSLIPFHFDAMFDFLLPSREKKETKKENRKRKKIIVFFHIFFLIHSFVIPFMHSLCALINNLTASTVSEAFLFFIFWPFCCCCCCCGGLLCSDWESTIFVIQFGQRTASIFWGLFANAYFYFWSLLWNNTIFTKRTKKK